MSTRSTIVVQSGPGPGRRFFGLYRSVYCHHDGYLEAPGVGHTLLNHYPLRHQAQGIIALGDLSSLGRVIGEAHSFDLMTSDRVYRAAHKHECVAYGRDRGEKETAARAHRNWRSVCAEAAGNNYLYMYGPDGWRYIHGPTPRTRRTALRQLGPAVAKAQTEAAIRQAAYEMEAENVIARALTTNP